MALERVGSSAGATYLATHLGAGVKDAEGETRAAGSRGHTGLRVWGERMNSPDVLRPVEGLRGLGDIRGRFS